jgi:hypothetical protein
MGDILVKNQLIIARIRLVLIITLIVVINIGSGYWFKNRVSGLETNLTLEETIKANCLVEKTREIRMMLENDIGNLITTGQIVASLPEVQSGFWYKMKDTLLLYETRVVSGSYMSFNYPNGTWYTTLQGRINGSVSDRQYFQTAIAGKVSIGETIYSRSTGLAVHITAIPVINGSNIVGVIIISTPLSNWSNSIASRLSISSPNLFFVLSMDGQTKLHQKTEMILSTNLLTGEGMNSTVPYASLRDFIKIALLKQEGMGIYKYGGFKMICGYTRMIDLPWMVFYAEKLK